MSDWDALRQKKKGAAGPLPRCSKCKRIRVLDPCRDCATPEQLNRYPDAPREYEPA